MDHKSARAHEIDVNDPNGSQPGKFGEKEIYFSLVHLYFSGVVSNFLLGRNFRGTDVIGLTQALARSGSTNHFCRVAWID